MTDWVVIGLNAELGRGIAMKDDAQFTGKKCPVCGSQTLKNNDGEWCSFTGCTYIDFPNLMLEQLGWKPIKLIPHNTPVIILLKGVVQHITYGLCGYDQRFYKVESDEFVDDKDFTPSHFKELPRAC